MITRLVMIQNGVNPGTDHESNQKRTISTESRQPALDGCIKNTVQFISYVAVEHAPFLPIAIWLRK